MISKTSLRSSTKLLIALVMVLGAVGLVLRGASFAPTSSVAVQSSFAQEPGVAKPVGDFARLPVQVQQLSARVANNVLLRCENARLSTPNEIADLTCYVRNNTRKQISAGSLEIFVFLDNKTTNPHSSSLSFDTFVHPDFRAEHPDNLIAQGAEYRLEDSVTTFDLPVTGVSATIGFIEFSDGTTLGPDRRGYQELNSRRAGARKYKEWLAAKYEANPSAETLISLLFPDDNLPPDLPVVDPNERQGATIFRNQLRGLFHTKGAEGLVKHFKTPK